jgi:hypothetical protein
MARLELLPFRSGDSDLSYHGGRRTKGVEWSAGDVVVRSSNGSMQSNTVEGSVIVEKKRREGSLSRYTQMVRIFF